MSDDIYVIASGSRIRVFGSRGSSSVHLYKFAWRKSDKSFVYGRGTAGWLGGFGWQTVISADVSYATAFFSLSVRPEFQKRFLGYIGKDDSERYLLTDGDVLVRRSVDRKYNERNLLVPTSLHFSFRYKDNEGHVGLPAPLFNGFRSAIRDLDMKKTLVMLSSPQTAP